MGRKGEAGAGGASIQHVPFAAISTSSPSLSAQFSTLPSSSTLDLFPPTSPDGLLLRWECNVHGKVPAAHCLKVLYGAFAGVAASRTCVLQAMRPNRVGLYSKSPIYLLVPFWRVVWKLECTYLKTASSCQSSTTTPAQKHHKRGMTVLTQLYVIWLSVNQGASIVSKILSKFKLLLSQISSSLE